MRIPVAVRWMAVLLASLLLASCDSGFSLSDGSANTGSNGGSTSGKVGHVFIIVLENKNYAETFDAQPAPAPYLAQTLPQMGMLLTQYYGTGHVSLDNYISMVSGQAPNPQTQSDCQLYTDFLELPLPIASDGQIVGNGCVYPAKVKTIGDQLQAAGLSWKSYAEDMASSVAAGVPGTCRRPAVNAQDKWQSATATDQYATRHVPFLYFHSIIDDQANCDARVVDLNVLNTDLQNIATTPNYVFITPDLCSDAHDEPCADGRPGGYASLNEFLMAWVPKITNSPAFKKDGLLIVTFDEAEVLKASADATACCNEQPGFNTPLPGITGPGGGRTGAVLLSPFIRPGSVNDTPYNHYAMLRSVEDIFGLPHLGYAGQNGLKAFGTDVFNNVP